MIIPAGSNGAYFTIMAGDTIGTVQIQATTNGYASTSLNMQVTIPQFSISIGTPLKSTSPVSTCSVIARDASDNQLYVNQDLTISLTSAATGIVSIDSTSVTIRA